MFFKLQRPVLLVRFLHGLKGTVHSLLCKKNKRHYSKNLRGSFSCKHCIFKDKWTKHFKKRKVGAFLVYLKQI